MFPSNTLAVEACGLNHNAAGKRAARGICGWRFRHGRGRSPNTEPYGITEWRGVCIQLVTYRS